VTERQRDREKERMAKEDLMMSRIREAENTQFVAELTQKISALEYKVGLAKKTERQKDID
jgi:hypothetical protein